MSDQDKNKPDSLQHTVPVTGLEGSKPIDNENAPVEGDARSASSSLPLEKKRRKRTHTLSADDKEVVPSPKHRHPLGTSVRPQQSSTFNAWLLLLALLLAGSAIAGNYWLWQQNQFVKDRLQQQAAQFDSMLVVISSLQQVIKNSDKLQQSDWQSYQLQQNKAIALIENQLNLSRDQSWLLAEAEYLIRLANHRLQLLQDVKTAISALTLADQRLQILDDPLLLRVRRHLSNDIGRLKAVAQLDITGMALSLADVQHYIQQLPLMGAISNNIKIEKNLAVPLTRVDVNTNKILYYLNDVWDSLRQLVTIRQVKDQSIAIVSPDQKNFLYQNLALKIESARLALLRHDNALYHQSLAMAQGWLQRYFDNQDKSVKELLSILLELDAVNLDYEVPIASASLQAIYLIKPQLAKAMNYKLEASPAATDIKAVEKLIEKNDKKIIKNKTLRINDTNTGLKAIKANSIESRVVQ